MDTGGIQSTAALFSTPPSAELANYPSESALDEVFRSAVNMCLNGRSLHFNAKQFLAENDSIVTFKEIFSIIASQHDEVLLSFYSSYNSVRHILNLAAIEVGGAPPKIGPIHGANLHIACYIYYQSLKRELVLAKMLDKKFIENNDTLGNLFDFIFHSISIEDLNSTLPAYELCDTEISWIICRLELENTAAKQILMDKFGAPKQPIQPPLPQPAPQKTCVHAVDFRSILWFGKSFTFTPTQSACIKVLWEHWEQGTPTVGEATILDESGSAGSRLRDLFKDHPAWDSLIVKSDKKDTFRLQEFPVPQEKPT